MGPKIGGRQWAPSARRHYGLRRGDRRRRHERGEQLEAARQARRSLPGLKRLEVPNRIEDRRGIVGFGDEAEREVAVEARPHRLRGREHVEHARKVPRFFGKLAMNFDALWI